MTENNVGRAVIAAAMRVHTALGPGLLETAYELCLAHELERRGFEVGRQVPVPIRYEDLNIEIAYRIDILVAATVVVELKVVEALLPIHRAQLLSYLRLGGYKLGYLLNFNVTHLRDGIARLVNGL